MIFYCKKRNLRFVESLSCCLSVLRPYWCCLQHLNENDTISLEEFITVSKQNRKINHANPVTNNLELFKEEESLESVRESLTKLELSKPKSRTCLCTDDRMTKHSNLINL